MATKCKNVKETEYEVRKISADGDCVDVDAFDNRASATDYADGVEFNGETVAVVVEKCVTEFRSDGKIMRREYSRVSERGDAEALAAGDWDKDI